MARQITWTREQRALAKTKDKELFAVGVESDGGHAIQTGLMPKHLGTKLFYFGTLLYVGYEPKTAFAVAFEGKKKPPKPKGELSGRSMSAKAKQ